MSARKIRDQRKSSCAKAAYTIMMELTPEDVILGRNGVRVVVAVRGVVVGIVFDVEAGVSTCGPAVDVGCKDKGVLLIRQFFHFSHFQSMDGPKK